jgi:hypothetical protein
MKTITENFTLYEMFANAPPDPYVQPDDDGYGMTARVGADSEEHSDEDAEMIERMNAEDDRIFIAEVKIPFGMKDKDVIVLLSQLITWISKDGIWGRLEKKQYDIR